MAARMVSFKNNKTSERYTLENKYNTTRYNLLLVIGFTLINIVLLVTNSDRYFPVTDIFCSRLTFPIPLQRWA